MDKCVAVGCVCILSKIQFSVLFYTFGSCIMDVYGCQFAPHLLCQVLYSFIQMSLKFVLKGFMANKSVYVQLRWRSIACFVKTPTLILSQFTDRYIHVTGSQRVKAGTLRDLWDVGILSSSLVLVFSQYDTMLMPRNALSAGFKGT